MLIVIGISGQYEFGGIMISYHAQVRCQQRGIPSQILKWLDLYGDKNYDGRGGVMRYFSHRSLKRVEREVGRVSSKELANYRDVYKIDSTANGVTITVGHRTRRIWR